MGYKGQGQKQSERKGGEREGMVFKRGEGKNGESGNGFHTGTSFPSSSPAPNKTIPFIPVVCLTYVERREIAPSYRLHEALLSRAAVHCVSVRSSTNVKRIVFASGR